MITIIIAVLISLPFLWWYSVLRRYKSISTIPGPPLLPVLGNVLEVGDSPQQFYKNMTRFQGQYGSIFKLFIANEARVVISNPELTEKILSSNIHITKANSYDLMKPWLGVGLLISTGPKWKSRRKMITPTFHFKILEQFLDIFNSCGNILVSKLSKEVGNNCLDIYPYINLYSLDVICETSMGVKISAQQGQNTEYVEAVRDFLEIFVIRVFSSWKRFDLSFKMSNQYKRHKESLKILHDFTNNVIKKRREEKLSKKLEPTVSEDGIKRKIALLDMLLECEHENKLSNEDIREEVDTFMFEGHDTTSSGIAFAMLALAENPEIQEQVYEEVISIIGEEPNENITIQQLNEAKYLEMVIKEVQRMYPSVPVFERLLEEDVNVGDYKFPKGAFVTFFVYAMHNDEKYFPNPKKFDPNRFLPENQSQRHNYVYVPFSAGPRNCIGQKFAMLEMKSAIMKIVQKFRILPVPAFKPDLGIAGVLRSFNGVCVRLEHRQGV